MSEAAGDVYEIFARVKLSEPLGHIGSIRAEGAELARAYARTTYDEDKWVEMVGVMRNDLIPIIELKTET